MIVRALMVAITLTLVATPAVAQYINSPNTGAAYARPQGAYSEQSLTTNRRDVSLYAGPFANPKFGTRTDAGFTVVRPGLDLTLTGFELGAAYGIARGFEAGLFLPVLELSPEAGLGATLPLFVTLATSVEDVDFGLRNTVGIPLEGQPVTWNPGLHGLVRFEGGRFEFGAFFPMAFGDPIVASLDVPLRAAFGFEDLVFITVDTGLRKGDLVNGANDLFLPLGMGLLASIEAGSHRLDIGGRFEWPLFAWLTAPEDTPDRVLEQSYQIWLGVVAHFDVAGN